MGLRESIATPEGKQRYVRGLFATIADRYDFVTRALSYGQDARWKRRLLALAQVTPGDRVLDLACGTGDLTIAHGAVGVDVTWRMLELARRRGASRLLQADMASLPFAAGAFTVVTTGYGLRNVPDLARAIDEIHRVLAPGGRLLSLDFNRPAQPVVRWAYLAYLNVVGALFGLALHGDPDTYRYIPESIRRYPGALGVARLLEARGFVGVRVLPLLGGLMTIHVAISPARDRARPGESRARPPR